MFLTLNFVMLKVFKIKKLGEKKQKYNTTHWPGILTGEVEVPASLHEALPAHEHAHTLTWSMQND
jgi:hypothetical protein